MAQWSQHTTQGAGDELATANVALKSKDWHAAMVDELESIKENKT
jgi:hypothetical protein